MYICYLDESGTVEKSDASGHFVLVGLAVMAEAWKSKDAQIDQIKAKFGIQGAEVHTAWMLREYPEQNFIKDFSLHTYDERRRLVVALRTQNLAKGRAKKQQKSLETNYRKTAAYVHLTRLERKKCVEELADLIGSWADARLFAEAQQKKSLPRGRR